MATTPNYGWTTPNDSDAFKDGALAIRTLGNGVDTTLKTALGGNYPGLRLVKTQTIGSGVSSVSVANAFSSTYQNYKILVNGGVGSGAAVITMQLTGSTANYSNNLIFSTWGSTAITAIAPVTTAFYYAAYMNSGMIDATIDVNAPFLAKPTTMFNSWKTTSEGGTANCYHSVAASYTGFTLTTTTGTMTGGTIYVYGYGAS